MATTTPTRLPEGDTSASQAPGPGSKARGRFATRGVLTWAAVLAAVAAAVALAVVTLTGGDDITKDRSNVERSERSDQTVNPNGPGAPASEHSTDWTTDEDQTVNPTARVPRPRNTRPTGPARTGEPQPRW
ncbi:MAG: hypothetical protein ACRD0R_13470 [Acidimicrobiales bacterium]